MATALPAPPSPEPSHPIHAPGELRNHSPKAAAFIGAQADKIGTPPHPAVKTIPAPIGLTTNISYLGQRHRNNIPTVPAASTYHRALRKSRGRPPPPPPGQKKRVAAGTAHRIQILPLNQSICCCHSVLLTAIGTESKTVIVEFPFTYGF